MWKAVSCRMGKHNAMTTMPCNRKRCAGHGATELSADGDVCPDLVLECPEG